MRDKVTGWVANGSPSRPGTSASDEVVVRRGLRMRHEFARALQDPDGGAERQCLLEQLGPGPVRESGLGDEADHVGVGEPESGVLPLVAQKRVGMPQERDEPVPLTLGADDHADPPVRRGQDPVGALGVARALERAAAG